eukprot:CAMPEP_0180810318 /NCGR_PEP_ID=MMETSP1038_2-20121128/64818_1 /TAXON_ID=632150 /ORGANISM="Azadinium spinosum, Strain 3D9" /LENGTH=41 /DNA_ID= /DNA_START= /DNA_END= /DNA_ORIENTATION=
MWSSASRRLSAPAPRPDLRTMIPDSRSPHHWMSGNSRAAPA